MFSAGAVAPHTRGTRRGVSGPAARCGRSRVSPLTRARGRSRVGLLAPRRRCFTCLHLPRRLPAGVVPGSPPVTGRTARSRGLLGSEHRRLPQPLDLLSDEALDRLQPARVLGGDERDRHSLATRARGAPDPVNVVSRRVRQVVVDDVRDVVDVDAACGDVGRDRAGRSFRPGSPRACGHARSGSDRRAWPMRGNRARAAGARVSCARLGPDEDDGPRHPVLSDQPLERRALAPPIDRDETLLDLHQFVAGGATSIRIGSFSMSLESVAISRSRVAEKSID